MKSKHTMPFGAEWIPGKGVRFRLWAPDADKVALDLYDPEGERHPPMNRLDDGWYELTVSEAGPGSRYRFRPDAGHPVPDPASRFNPGDVHGPSEVVDPSAYTWRHADWRGRPWEETVLYELHVGTFTPEGTFRAVIDRLDHLQGLGITALELMPVAAFPGSRNWGYDGVLPFAPAAAYGRPEDLKALIDAAHGKGLMVFLDVVYNHFGPEGNYLHLYASQFFTERHHTPWGAAINFDDEGSRTVRDFFVHNALYWLEEFRFDGLRLDAVHAILDDSEKHILEALAEAVQSGPGRERRIHLVLENDANQARFLARSNSDPKWYAAQWNDDFHHACHVLLTKESDGYYADYSSEPAFLSSDSSKQGSPRKHALHYLGRCLTQGYAWQGEPSPFRKGEARGTPSGHLPAAAFVTFLQNHDQVGNRAFGERLTQLSDPVAFRAALAIMLLSPSVPLLFMGEEFGADTPFLFFCDFGEDLHNAVRDGRRREFAHFERFSDPAVRETIPDPCVFETFAASRLDWGSLENPEAEQWLDFYRQLLALRRREIIPRLAGAQGHDYRVWESRGLQAAWRMGDGSLLTLLANLSGQPLRKLEIPSGSLIGTQPEGIGRRLDEQLPPWSLAWFLA
ncbi:MAG: malto-oligosyltrehalose trehalohydrolase [Methylohalobius sp. ZOD2]